MRSYLHYLLTLAFGALGAGAVVVGIHMWQDHRTLHSVVDYLNRAAQQAAQTSQTFSPAPPPGPGATK